MARLGKGVRERKDGLLEKRFSVNGERFSVFGHTQKEITEKEIELLPMGAKVMTFECGMRFLTDYLQGDVYFKTRYPGHNLDRARTQIELVKDMNRKWQTMKDIVKKYI